MPAHTYLDAMSDFMAFSWHDFMYKKNIATANIVSKQMQQFYTKYVMIAQAAYTFHITQSGEAHSVRSAGGQYRSQCGR